MERVKEFQRSLTDDDRLLINIRTVAGIIVDFRIVYQAVLWGAWREVMRYDCNHGFPHKDLFYVRGEEKVKVPIGLDIHDAYYFSLAEVSKDFKEMKIKYEAKYKGEFQ